MSKRKDMINRKSIFDIERRINLQEEHIKLVEHMNVSTVLSDFGFKTSFYYYINESVKTWKHRGSAFNIKQYVDAITYCDAESLEDYTDEETICCLELYLNLIIFAVKGLNTSGWTTNDRITFNSIAKRIIENIDYVLEHVNMRYYEQEDRVIICKRDCDVDSVLEINPEISDVLLEYLDFRNSEDISFKKEALIQIANYIEPKRAKFSQLNNKLCDTLFYAFNSFGIRHNNEKQIVFESKEKQMKTYDKIFKMALHLLRSDEVKEYTKEIELYKKN